LIKCVGIVGHDNTTSSAVFDFEEDFNYESNEEVEVIEISDDEEQTPTSISGTITVLLQLMSQAILHKYQKFGVQWMQEREEEFHGGILADAMRLGKTSIYSDSVCQITFE
jgi:SNF2 family DNA or RNA helicase